jgi:CRISPR-associated protein Cas1
MRIAELLLRPLRRPDSPEPSQRTPDTPPTIPAVASPIAHLAGPGKLGVENQRLCFSTPNVRQLFLDPKSLQEIVCYGGVSITPAALRLLTSRGVHVAMLSSHGDHFIARWDPGDTSRTLVRLIQYHVVLQPQVALLIARQHVIAKIESQIAATRHYQRQGKTAQANEPLQKLEKALNDARYAKDLDTLRGIEGAATAIWFRVYSGAILPPFKFERRVRRPPTDPVNALLSLGYSLLTRRVAARIQAAGLEPNLGTLHAYRAGRPSLACDLVEPLRIPAVDRWVLSLCNRRQVQPDHFRTAADDADNPAVTLKHEELPRVIAAWERHWYEERFSEMLDRQLSNYIADLRHRSFTWPQLRRLLEQKSVHNAVPDEPPVTPQSPAA